MPALGGKVRDMNLGGRQWLWHNPDVPFALPREGARYEELEAAGGFDECFPTVGSCRLPRWVEGARWREASRSRRTLGAAAGVRDHDRPGGTFGDVHVERRGAAVPVHAPHHGASRGMGGVRVLGDEHRDASHSILWSSHPVFPLTPRTRIVLPDGARVKLCSQSGVDFGKPGDGASVAASHGADAAGRQARGSVAAVRRDRRGLLVQAFRRAAAARSDRRGRGGECAARDACCTAAKFRRSAFRSTGEASAPGARARAAGRSGKKRAPACTIAIEPCLGAPESLSDALGDWDDAHWLEPGGTARWGMTWRGWLRAGRQTADGRRRMTADDLTAFDARRLLFEDLSIMRGCFRRRRFRWRRRWRVTTSTGAGRNAWALGKFVVPVARLAEFEDARPAAGRRCAVAARADRGRGFQRRRSARSRSSRGAPASARDVARDRGEGGDARSDRGDRERAPRCFARTLPGPFDIYVEVPVASDPSRAHRGDRRRTALRAKVRTGGVEAGAFPTADAARAISRRVRARTT